MLAAFAMDWSQGVALASGTLNRVVGGTQVVEVLEHLVNFAERTRGFQHVVADEVVKVADRFHRYGLVEQVQRLLGDAHGRAEGCGVVGERIESLGGGR